MGKSGSKPEKKPEEKPVDNRELLSRKFGEKYSEYWNRLDQLEALPIEDTLKRPVHSSLYWRDLPMYQGLLTYFGLLVLVMRKLPFTNPAVRVGIWLIGIDMCRSCSRRVARISEDEVNELSCFYMLKEKLTTWKGIRNPDFTEEDEDWHLFNKPAYRVPVGMEFSPDTLARFLFVNMRKFEQRNTEWHGEWEQENALTMDLHAPHADYWLTHH
jgi:hypothetical protein